MKEILILTDDIISYSKYRSLLEDANIEINHITSVAGFFALSKKIKFDLIIIEFDYPKFKSQHLTILKKILLSIPNGINIVNDIDSNTLEKCMELGCEVFVKPFDENLLRNNVINTLNIDEKNEDSLKFKDCLDDSPFCDIENYSEEDNYER